jgi:hypothetical protein
LAADSTCPVSALLRHVDYFRVPRDSEGVAINIQQYPGDGHKNGHENGVAGTIVLFVSQGDHRIDTHGAARGNVTGHHGNQKRYGGDGKERRRIRGGDSVKQTGH